MSDHDTAFVLGGTGFVGPHIVAALCGGGYRAVSVSRAAGSAGTEHISLDLGTEDPRPLSELLRRYRPAVVVNAAGTYWGLDEPRMRRSLIAPAETTLAALAAVPESRSRYVHLGSVLEYGPLPAAGRLDESAPTEPESVYGRVKLAATRVVLAAVADGRTDGIVLRVTNSIGPGMHPGTLIGRVGGLLANHRTGRARVELSPLSAHRDFIDVRDLGAAVLAAARARNPPTVVNIGAGQAVPVRHLVDRLIEISAVPTDVIESATGPTALGADTNWLEVATDTAEQTLGWRATRTVDQALSDYWASLVT
ncbi:dTDP-6-deoxy-L-talose 4-dehydrogenase [NAD(P)+] [Nocardia tenerifensis]|uniref:dTDP-6-deoxy-L-talose 4-dehydrogenase [NAD(P)+] n=1 Tax=Nocardia tenerifensis TaxID=228006 RepID=A0A318K7J0_9NOCA|nr:NAD-dependent epimerase/dehydratase family protein [Nocardia tenerifensis]PXX59758.1 dTDP-6-deoxy-L-talose 4-dehydrogenase [NAD(P)+] [Nocardia tenerifensis]